MFSDEVAIRVDGVGKCYHIYNRPYDRLKQAFWRGRRRYFQEFWALRDVSLEVRRGETVAILGRNGSGKSTLLQMICGILAPTSGRVRINGRVAALLELGAGFNPEFTGRENVFMNASVLGLGKAEIRARFDRIVEFAELGDFIDQPLKTYSSGMAVRLAFAVAINVNPDVLIVDEALAVGDMRFQAKCLDRLGHLQAAGVTVLFVSHDISSVRQFCSRAIWLDSGRTVMMGSANEVTAKYAEYMFSDSSIETALANFDNAVEESEPGDKSVLPAEPLLIDQPINRWGSQSGIIDGCALFGSSGDLMRVAMLGEMLRIRLSFRMPTGIKPESVSAAVSIKNKAGTDLIVSTTHDEHSVRFDGLSTSYRVEFELPNFLAEGEYYLVAAIEDRTGRQPVYFDYIEGAWYFKVMGDKRLFGLFHPPVVQRIYMLDTLK